MKQLATWRYLARMGRYRPWLSLLHASLWGLNSFTWFLAGLLAQAFFDTLSGQSPSTLGTNGVLVLLVVLALSRALIWLSAGSVEILMRFTMSGLLRRNLLHGLLQQPGASALPYSIGETISRLRDDAHQGEDTMDWSDEIIVQSLFTIGAFLVLLHIDVQMALIVTLPLLLVTILARQASIALGRYREVSSQATSQVTGAIGDILAAVQTVQAAGAEERVVARFRELNERRRKAMLRDRVATQVVGAITENTVSLGTGLIMLLAASRMRGGSITVGDFALFVAYLGFISSFTTSLGAFLASYRQVGVAFARMVALLGNAPASALVAHNPLHLRGPLPAVPQVVRQASDRLTLLEVKGLSYRYPQSGRGIDAIDLRLPRGSLTVVTGRVGAGKTTLLQTLIGLLTSQAGEIRWNSQPVTDAANFFVPPRAAYTAQVPRLFSETLRQNILLGLPEHRERLAEAIHLAVMEQDVEMLEAGLQTMIGTRGVKLSGGQAQRSAAARMFFREPELLVFDDLSSALDVTTEQQLWERLLARRSEEHSPTCMLVSHRHSVLQRADHILVLNEGRIEASGTAAELLLTSAEFRAIWSSEREDTSV